MFGPLCIYTSVNFTFTLFIMSEYEYLSKSENNHIILDY